MVAEEAAEREERMDRRVARVAADGSGVSISVEHRERVRSWPSGRSEIGVAAAQCHMKA